MTLAIAADHEQVAAHFGRCERYVLYDIKDGQATSMKTIKTPRHEKDLMPKLLRENDVDALICGGIGRRAKNHLDRDGITCYSGLKGTLDEALKAYVEGTLPHHDEVCEEHAFHGENQ